MNFVQGARGLRIPSRVSRTQAKTLCQTMVHRTRTHMPRSVPPDEGSCLSFLVFRLCRAAGLMGVRSSKR